MDVYIDIETIPAQSGLHSYEYYLEAEKQSFKAPSSLTKAKACADLGLTGDDAKFTGKDAAIELWEVKFAEVKAPEVAEDKWRKTSFDGGAGELISIAWAVEDGEIIGVSRELGGSEKLMLASFFDLLSNELGRIKPFFIGQYIGGFDLKFLFHRAVILGVEPPFDLPFDGRHNKDYYCTQAAWAGYGGRMSQDNLCKALGIEGKPDDIDGSQVWDFVKTGNVKRVAEYNKDDVNKVRQIHKRLTFKGNK
tara:strand:+ start:23670 stop:24419 length:750 start_codon:yes stop_codon:yes gene_type:complete